MSNSPVHDIAYLAAAQPNAELKANDAITKLEQLARFAAIEDDSLSTPPNELTSSGDRTATVTVTKSSGISNGGSSVLSNLVDGATADNDTDSWKPASAVNVQDEWIQLQLTTAAKVLEFIWNVSATTAAGTWKVQGSADGIGWTDISADTSFSRTGAGTITFAITAPQSFQYYRFLGISGTFDTAPYYREITWTYEDNTSMTNGDSYIVGSSPTGAWTGLADNILIWNDGWLSVPPKEGDVYAQRNTPFGLYRYGGSSWALWRRATHQVDLTDNTTGTDGGIVEDVGISYSQSTLNDNFAGVIGAINGIIAKLESAGLMSTS